ncbi:hypothetical protein [Brasilonema bromeliae]|uniref:Uncharacterized protein n=1 Tax=Brasilonema bromeliae SPC951 TaxID=385972 RepID=A0ABX1PD29_9CYAN|nr:hypothetical protein [Brasilonema bromeliae]NMG22392.1 hypothetical protein [Brasilonema bromeliae SPC951]
MIGFIKNLITGVLNFFTGLLGGNKNGYYLELDEAAEATKEAAKQAASKAQEAVEPVVSKAQEAVGSVVSKAQEAVEPVTSKAQEAIKPVAAKAKKTAKSVATQAATNNGTKDAVKPQPNVQLVQTAVGVKPEPVQSEKAKAIIQKEPTETTFAPKYLAVPNTSNGRRRPGANMSSFLDMANQVKTSK